MASLSDKISAGTGIFTAIAAIAAAMSAFFSFQQSDITRQNQLDAERLIAFDKFTDKAAEVCTLFSVPKLDRVWDRKADDFRADFDLTPIIGRKPENPPAILEDQSDKSVKIDQIFNDLTMQAARLFRLESRTFDAHNVDSFIDELRFIAAPLENPPVHKDEADELRYIIKASHIALSRCHNSVYNLMKAYSKIFKFD